MATKEEIYVSFKTQDYKKSKSILLESKANTLIVLKHLHNLKILSRQKNDLKKRLYSLTSSTINLLDSLQEKMPTPNIPKSIKKNLDLPKEEIKKTSSKKDYSSIDEELEEINQKLKNLHLTN